MPILAETTKRRVRVDITGTVQGVGFRPFIFRLAKECCLAGYVLNHDRGVTLEAEGPSEQVALFLKRLPCEIPPAARLDSLTCQGQTPVNESTFEIRESLKKSDNKFVAISPDLMLCADCRRELLDPSDRRYLYPFINCTNCGPRFTIIRDVPYDREKTTMAPFPMCPDCRREYENPLDRRFHAQPNACPKCGPSLAQPLSTSVKLLKEGKILAIKGLGGYHLACDALNETAVCSLRSRKQREQKPFAVMFRCTEEAERFVKMTGETAKWLTSPEAPIVLLEKTNELAPSVAPKNRFLGVMLPTTPLHTVLLETFGGPLVMTSGNLSDEPIAVDDSDALARLSGIADAFLTHNREIHVRCDDSVIRPFRGEQFFIRRSRGYAPRAIQVRKPFATSILGVGSHLKNTFCLTRDNQAFVSHHIGDLENLATLSSLETGISHFENLFNIRPTAIAHDLHPDYLSTRWVREKFTDPEWENRIFGIQHHHAHIAACIEENAYDGAVLGLALDGTGFGTDGTIWGGEIMLADRRDYLRVGRFRPGPLPGGDRAIKNPWRIAFAYLAEAAPEFIERDELPATLAKQPESQRKILRQMLAGRLNTPLSSSCGRLFDAVSVLAGVTAESHYEGQPAIELERALNASLEIASGYSFDLSERNGLLELDWRPVIKAVASDSAKSRMEPALISLRFHTALENVLLEATKKLARKYGLNAIALSGGCLMNERLRERLYSSLETEGFRVLFPKKLPTNDGGISFGQVVVANQLLEGKESCVWQYR